jgi:hypothetical protein
MSLLTFAIADQLADDACGPVWGSHIRRDTRRGRIARAARSAAASAGAAARARSGNPGAGTVASSPRQNTRQIRPCVRFRAGCVSGTS